MKKYICDRCGIEDEVDGNLKMNGGYAGIECTVAQFMELTKDNPNVWQVCKKCLDKMEDAAPYFESGQVTAVPNPEKFN